MATKKPLRFWGELQGNIKVFEEISKRRKKEQAIKEKGSELYLKDSESKEIELAFDFIKSNTTNYQSLFKRFVYDMEVYNFKKTSSVDSKVEKMYNDKNNRYDMFATLNLFEHTMNVVTQAIIVASELPSFQKDICIMIALLHDYGKNSEIKNKYSFEDKKDIPHNVISANYAKSIMSDEMLSVQSNGQITDELIKTVDSCLRTHHDQDAKSNLFLKVLIKADKNAREKELQGLLLRKQRKRIFDNKKEQEVWQ